MAKPPADFLPAADPPEAAPPPPSRPRRRPAARGGARSRRRKKRRSWRERGKRAWKIVKKIPPALLIAALLLVLAVGVATANILHWVAKKPTELLAPVSGAFIKKPEDTWASYGELFRQYSTAAIPPELLAALAQVESAGNPAAHTYWRWNPSATDIFGIYRPASSSVGMFQMTDGAYAEAAHYCIRHHAVVKSDGSGACGFDPLVSRVLPSESVELAAIYLDRAVARLLEGRAATLQQKHDLATLVHLCGPGQAEGYVRRGFRLARGESCGDHDPADYLAQVNALERRFRRLAE